MSNYPELIQRIFSQQKASKVEALRKLIYLSVNQQNRFSQYVQQIAQQLPKTLIQMEDQQIKLLSLQLLSEMATNYTSKIPAHCYSFPQLVGLLSDENSEVRKSAHYLILIFIKKYQQIDEVIAGYLERIQDAPEHWKVLQKIIHSFQSLLVIEPKCITYGQDYKHMDDFMKVLLEHRHHSHSLVQKASEQTVSSFVKNQHVPEILPKLDKKITAELIEIAKKISINLQPKKRKRSPQKEPQDDIDIINIPHRKTSVLQQLLERLDSESDWKIKSQTIEEISKQLAGGSSDFPEDLIEKVLDLTYDYNFKTCMSAMNALLSIVTDYQSKLSPRYRQIQDVVIDKICDLKMAVRQLANKILRKLYTNHSKDFIKRLLSKLNNCSIVGKEQILSFLQQTFTSNILNDPNLVLGQISNQLLNENTRVKIKAIQCLVKISTANDLQECKLILSKKLKKVYFDMYMERLRENIGVVEKVQIWDQKNKMKKGMTWQAPERISPVIEASDQQSMTKVQFGNKKNFFQTEEDFSYCNQMPKNKQKPYGATSSNSYKTANTFDTFKSNEQSNAEKLKIQPQQKSTYLSFDSGLNKQQVTEEKKLPLKPNPVKKRTILQQKQQKEQKSDKNILVIQSKQYMTNKNGDEYSMMPSSMQEKREVKQYVEQKPKLKLNRKNRDRSNLKIKEEEEKQEPKQKTLASEPFSIKKSGSKKEHTIDYKATQYISKEQLAPVENPKQMLKTILASLPKDNDWEGQFKAMDGLRRLIKNHDDFYPILAQNFPGIMPELLKLAISERSTLSKNSLMTLSQMCEALKKNMDPYLQPIFIKLFKKSQDANSFIVEEVRKCMSSLCTYCNSSKIVTIIVANSTSKSVAVKSKAALCVDKLLQKNQYDCQILKDNSKLVSVMSNMIVDGSAQVRGTIKQVFLQLLQNNNVGQIEGIFKRMSSKDSWQKWKHIMDRDFELRRKR